jgi:hypothetical protein
MRTLAFIIVCLISWPALAFDATTGQMSCATWLQERGKLKSWVQSHNVPHGEMPTGTLVGGVYLIGFIEGYEWACPATKPRGSGLDMESAQRTFANQRAAIRLCFWLRLT